MVRMTSPTEERGLAVLAGAGPGGAELLTAEARDWLSRADVVLYDRLVSRDILAFCRADAERVYVGKRPGRHALAQEEINRQLVAHCRRGRLVVRLKGGDPLVFGRGGEEADALAAAGCRFRIVPGVTAAVAAGAYAGIPLTDRRAAASVAFVTGHEDPARERSALDYEALARIDTVVFYMGVGNLAAIAERLQAAGRRGETPVALVENAATPRQRAVTATLATAADAADAAGVRPPAVLIVGEVVRLRERIAWLETLPLFGRTVLVTRTRRQASALSRRLAELGAHAIEAPTIEIHPPADWAPVDAALRRLAEFDWLVLTSPNGAAALVERMTALGLDARALAGTKLAAVGPATADALRERFLAPDLLPEAFTTEALGEALVQRLAADGAGGGRPRILLARADIATGILPEALRSAGCEVEQVTLYRTVRPGALPADALDALRAGRVSWVTFASSSTVENFLALIEPAGVSLEGIKLAAIGPVTAETLRSRGLPPAVVARPHTVEALVDALVREEAGGAVPPAPAGG
jgi:uroporphyrinogen III methyltransferase/synthase